MARGSNTHEKRKRENSRRTKAEGTESGTCRVKQKCVKAQGNLLL